MRFVIISLMVIFSVQTFANEKLIKAVVDNNLVAVKNIIENDPTVNLEFEAGWIESTPLMMALFEGYTDIVHYLVLSGANTKYVSEKGTTSLHYSVWSGKLELVELIFKHFPEAINRIEDEGNPPIFVAIRSRNEDIFHFLIEKGADIKLVKEALDLSLRGPIGVTAGLINAGADLNERNELNLTPVMAATFYREYEAVKLIAKAGADLNIISDQRYKSRTILIYAAMMQDAKLVKILLDAGADKTIRDDYGFTALDIAITYNNKEIIGLLKN